MILLIEGVDGVGKTTLAALLAPLIDAAVLASPSHNGSLGKLLRSIQDTKPFLPAAMVHLYVAEQLLIEEDLGAIYPHVKSHVILDRHCMTSGPAYRPEPWSVLWPILNLGGTFRRPDLGVFLDASTTTIRQRLIANDHPIPWTDDTINAIRRRLLEGVQRFARRTITVRSDELTPEEIVSMVQREMAVVEAISKPRAKPPSLPPPPKDELCIDCHGIATWIRHTQFAGDHPFCDSHARIQPDFGNCDSTKDWEQLH